MTTAVPAFILPLPLHPEVTAFSTLRAGGVSRGEYASFNICPYTGDQSEDVEINRCLLANFLGIPDNHIVLPHQTHSTEVRSLDTPIALHTLEGVDALITDKPGLCVGVSTADCIPVLLYDAAHRAVAAIHAGWRGTKGRIVERTLSLMQKEYGTRPAKLFAAIGPGISGDAYEVGDELPQQFCEAGFPMDEIAFKINGHYHLDLPRANTLELIRLGVPADHIHHCNLCTYTHHQRFFSARRQGISSGRIFTGILIPN